MTVVYCFSHDDVAIVHLKHATSKHTLCGKRAFPRLQRERTKVTCDKCLSLKPRQHNMAA
jgi:hypothetical protein